MSTSLLYQRFGIRGYKYSPHRLPQWQSDLHHFPRTPNVSLFFLRFASCHLSRPGRSPLPAPCPSAVGERPSSFFPSLVWNVRRVGERHQVKISFADPRRSYTKPFERYALELSRSMTIRDVALHLDVGWDLIKDIQKRDLSRRYRQAQAQTPAGTSPSTRSPSPRGIAT